MTTQDLVILPAHTKMCQGLCWCSLVKNRILDTFSNLFQTRLHHPNIKQLWKKETVEEVCNRVICDRFYS